MAQSLGIDGQGGAGSDGPLMPSPVSVSLVFTAIYVI